MDFQITRAHILFFIAGYVLLSNTAEKCRQLVGEETASKSGRFTFLDCFDMHTGTLACALEEGVKLYFYNLKASHVERTRTQAIERALEDSVSQGMPAKVAAQQAQKEGKKAVKLATRRADRVIGPLISCGWDYFDSIYHGASVGEGFLRGMGTLFGTYGGGFVGEQRIGRVGYLVGSHMGNWIGGRIGLMVYDVVHGVHYLLNFVQMEESED
ncbi:hypothetical protein PTKIN_Ptkin06aG0217300 [Pterospermum kingtungense]